MELVLLAALVPKPAWVSPPAMDDRKAAETLIKIANAKREEYDPSKP